MSRLSHARKFVTGVVALYAGLFILTSGPRTVLGQQAEEAEPGERPEVLWQVLSGLNYMTGELSEELEPFLGKEVKIPGFMVPLEDFAQEASEFLLVPYVGACVHTPPPPPNQLVYVKMDEEKRVPVSFWDPVWIHGTLVLETTTNQYTQVSFKLDGIKVEEYTW